MNLREFDAVDLLEELGADNVERMRSGEVRYSCPLTEGHPFGDRRPSAHLNEEKMVWRCKGCQKAGTVLDLVVRILPAPPGATLHNRVEHARRFLRERYGEGVRPPRGGSVAAEMALIEQQRLDAAVHVDPPEVALLATKVDWEREVDDPRPFARYMLGLDGGRKRGFAPATLSRWQIGYDPRTDRITIPLFSPDGKLAGFKARTYRIEQHDQPKYMLLGDHAGQEGRYGWHMPDTNQLVFGLHRARRAAKVTRRLVVCEGELDAVACHAAGVLDAVCLGTASCSDGQARLLRMHAREIVLFLDPDAGGETGAASVIDKLSERMPIKLVVGADEDPADLPPADLVDLVAGAKGWMSLTVDV